LSIYKITAYLQKWNIKEVHSENRLLDNLFGRYQVDFVETVNYNCVGCEGACDLCEQCVTYSYGYNVTLLTQSEPGDPSGSVGEYNGGSGGSSSNNNDNQDECPEGQVKSPETGNCVPIEQACPDTDKTYNENTERCECIGSNKIQNSAGKCVENPCRYINLQIQNPNYTQQSNELEGKTGLKKETGYKQNKDGSQVPLNDTNNGHSLDIPVNTNTVGYMHTHLNDFLTGKIDPKTGDEELKKPIKIFSPADILKFLQIVKNSKYNGVPTHLVYGTVIASTGNYTLRFTGNPDDIIGLGSANSYRADYKKYFEEDYKNNKEKAFLHFLKDKIGINGINLYRIRDNGDIEKKIIKENGRVKTSNCE